MLASMVCDGLPAHDVGWPWTDLAGLLLLLPTAWALFGVQAAANAACGDANGAGNKHFSAANLAGIAFGVLVWLRLIVGLLELFGVINVEAG